MAIDHPLQPRGTTGLLRPRADDGEAMERYVRRWSRGRPGPVLRALRPVELLIGGRRVFARFSPAESPAEPDPEPGDGGPGVPVVFVHGVGVSGLYFVPTAERVPRRHAVLLPDLPGFGNSDKPRRIGSLDDLSDEVAAAMDAAAIDRALLVGNSFGCAIATRVAQRHHERVAGLLLQGPTGNPAGPTYLAPILRGLRDLPREPLALMPVLLRDYLRCGFRRLWQAFRLSEQNGLRPALEGIRVPTRIVVGAHDAIVHRDWVRQVAASVPGVEMAVIEGAHAANFSHPQGLIGAMEGLLRG